MPIKWFDRLAMVQPVLPRRKWWYTLIIASFGLIATILLTFRLLPSTDRTLFSGARKIYDFSTICRADEMHYSISTSELYFFPDSLYSNVSPFRYNWMTGQLSSIASGTHAQDQMDDDYGQERVSPNGEFLLFTRHGMTCLSRLSRPGITEYPQIYSHTLFWSNDSRYWGALEEDPTANYDRFFLNSVSANNRHFSMPIAPTHVFNRDIKNIDGRHIVLLSDKYLMADNWHKSRSSKPLSIMVYKVPLPMGDKVLICEVPIPSDAYVDEVEISPDGMWMACILNCAHRPSFVEAISGHLFAVTHERFQTIWISRLFGKESFSLGHVELLSGGESLSGLSWMPDSSCVSFISNNALWVRNIR